MSWRAAPCSAVRPPSIRAIWAGRLRPGWRGDRGGGGGRRARAGPGAGRGRDARAGLVRAARQRLLAGPAGDRREAGLDLDAEPPELGRPLGEELLTPTTIYARDCLALAAGCDVHAFAHVTGGGLAANLARVLPRGRVPPWTAGPGGRLRSSACWRGMAGSARTRWSGSSTWASAWSPWSGRRRRPCAMQLLRHLHAGDVISA